MQTKLLIYSFAFTLLSFGESESFYRDKWAEENDGQTEVKLPDGTWCDVVTATHVVEVEKGHKWYEAIGQSMWYQFQLQEQEKRAGIVLIIEDEKDHGFLLKLKSLIAFRKLEIDVFTITP